MKKQSLTALGLILGLSACGGGGFGGLAGYAEAFGEFNGDPTLVSPVADATLNTFNSAVNYDGVVNIGTDSDTNPAGAASYYGSLDVTVNFSNATTNDAINGTAGDFVQFFSEIASPKTGESVPGSITITGALTGSNQTGLGDGLVGTATGSIDGIDVAYDLDGNITGVGGNGLVLYFDGSNADSTGGVGFAVD